MKAMKSISNLVGASCCLVVLLCLVAGQTEARGQHDDHEQQAAKIRSKRQASSSSRATSDKQQVGVSVAAGAGVSASSPALKPTRPMVSTSDAANPMGEDHDEEEPQQLRPIRKQNRPRRPNSDERYDDFRRGHDDDADCDEEGQDSYGNMFQSMATNPMRHFRRMMNSVFDRIPNNFDFYGGSDYDGADDYRGNRRSGDSVASSAGAAFNSADGGYSKLSSSVTSNGRTRGIISETRNGRTKTRRIGDDRDDAEE